ncbi:MAG TPA: glycoside hydrolase family 2 TIM barrel-domain containing protein [Polyangiaceae bacterium]|nr:glycoside hydrolase family 2 TIM barrel-domain containing protein [Polyangiaceae bacterium]
MGVAITCAFRSWCRVSLLCAACIGCGNGNGGTAVLGAGGSAASAGSAGHSPNPSMGSAGMMTGSAAGSGASSAVGGAPSSASGGSGGLSGALENGGASGAGGSGPSAPARTPGNGYDGGRATTISFDADWKFHLGDTSGAQASAFDDSSWSALSVPHDWSISLPFNQKSPAGSGGGYLDGGVGWYRKTFSLPAAGSGQRIFVQFDGVYMDSTVWLNGTQICARPYGYSSFECELTANAKLGADNTLAVRVNNTLPSSRWYSGSGIYRHVWLKTVNAVRVAYTGTRVTTPQISSTSATVDIAVSVQNSASSDQTVTVTSSLRDAAGSELAQVKSPAKVIPAGKSADVTQTANVANPKLWSTTSPTLYSVLTTVSVNEAVVDSYTTPFGIRSFAFDANTGFSLNGKNMKINGVCLHHDLGSLGAAVNTRAIEKRLLLLKDMGVNALRTSHNPPAPELLDLADRMGFLVMDEAFDMWYGSKTANDYSRFFKQWATTDITDMVARDLNHPSIIIWSIGNEIPQAADETVAQQLISAVKSKDQTRAVAQAFASWAFGEGTAGREDIVGINYAADMYDSLHKSHPTWKLFASESSSAFRSRGIYNNDNTQATSYDTNVAGWGASSEKSWTDVNTRAWVAGEFIWTGVDYIGEPTPYEWPAKSSYFGAIDTANFPKDIFYFYQSRWNYDGPPMVHIVPMDWTSWTVGKNVQVFVYSNADSVELFLNGKSLGSKTVDPVAGHANAGHLLWSVPFATGTLQAKASKNGNQVATDTVQTAGAASALKLKADRAAIDADGRDLSFVEIDVTDSQGVLVPQANNKIDFALTGPGTLAGVDNGDAISHESYKANSRSAFSGKALAIIQSSTTPGTITLKATSGSLTGASVTITTAAPKAP